MVAPFFDAGYLTNG